MDKDIKGGFRKGRHAVDKLLYCVFKKKMVMIFLSVMSSFVFKSFAEVKITKSLQ